MPIDQLCAGDEVFAQDEATGEVSLRKFVRTFVRKAAPIVAVTLIGTASPAVAEVGAVDAAAASGLVTLNTTEEHPFLVERGDVDAWVQAASLKPGDEVVTASGEPAVVVAIQFTGRRATVYNIEVEGLHNYSVGIDGIVVHNSVCKLIREWYETQVGRIPQRAISKGGATLENAKWAHAERNRLRDAARDRMRQNGLAEQADQLDQTDPNWTWDAIYKRYDGDPRRIIEAADRSRAFDLGD